jgi:hypothetical protein
MRSPFPGGLAALAAFALTASSLPAKVAAPPPVPYRVARADVALVGKVVRVEDKAVTLPDGAEMRVAVVQVGTPVMGLNGVTHVRVAFPAGENTRFPHMSLKAGQEGLFTLHDAGAKEPLYAARYYWDVVAKDGPQFATEVEQAKKFGKMLDDRLAGLKSADEKERLLTAALLVTRYRTSEPGAAKQVPIDAAESKLILEALAAADPTAEIPQLPGATPLSLVLQLGLDARDGWEQPKDFNALAAAAQKWLRDNAGTYRIRRGVAGAP